jgi:hypothetical protein
MEESNSWVIVQDDSVALETLAEFPFESPAAGSTPELFAVGRRLARKSRRGSRRQTAEQSSPRERRVSSQVVCRLGVY